MTASWQDPNPGESGRDRRRTGGRNMLRLVGLALVIALVAGAVAVRLSDDPGSRPPTLYDDPDTGAVPSAPVSGTAAGRPDDAPSPRDPAVDLAADPAVASGSEGGREPEPEPSVYVPPTPPDGWADPSEPSPATLDPVPDSLRVPKPDAVRGIYVGSWSVGSRRRLAALVALADATEINTFVVDIKDVTGEVSHRTRVPLAEQLEADRRVRIPDVPALLDTLRAHGIYPIARIVAFKDPLLAVARPEWSVKRTDGDPWEDDNGVRWVDSFNENVWDYNIELAREAVALGFAEVQWDYVRFPDVPGSYPVEAVYPARDGRTKTQAIREFLGYSAQRLADLEVPVTADVFGITTSTTRDIGIGQVWEAMSDQVDVLLPMVYPSHYPTGSWHYETPNAAPYQIVKLALEDGVARSDTIPDAAAIRPWLQAFSLGEPAYGPMHIRAQIDATYDAGLSEWVLWHPGVRYPVEAFTDANGIEPWFAGMGEALYEPDRGDAEAEPAEGSDGEAVDAADGETVDTASGEPFDAAGGEAVDTVGGDAVEEPDPAGPGGG